MSNRKRGSSKKGSTSKVARKPAKPKTEKPTSPEPEVTGGVIVTAVRGPQGGEQIQMQPIDGTTPREIPTLLRQAAVMAEKQLVGD